MIDHNCAPIGYIAIENPDNGKDICVNCDLFDECMEPFGNMLFYEQCSFPYRIDGKSVCFKKLHQVEGLLGDV